MLPDWLTMPADEKDAMLAKLVAKGLAFSAIATHFRNATRNAVIGRVHRMQDAGGLVKPNNRVKPFSPDEIEEIAGMIRRGDIVTFSTAAKVTVESIRVSDKERVETDKRNGGGVMSTALGEASFYLNELTKMHHRGRGDTLTAARDRAAKGAGVPRTYAKRIWDRLDSMKDVSGEAYLKLRIAYEASCERHEAKAAEYRAERRELRNAVATRPGGQGMAADHAGD